VAEKYRRIKRSKKEEEYIKYKRELRKVLKPGSEFYCVISRTTRSGRGIYAKVYAVVNGEIWRLTYWVGAVIGGYKVKQDDISVYSLDDLKYQLSYHLHPAGFICTGDRMCPSNDHSNGDRNYEPHQHTTPGYSLRYRWLS